MTFSWPPLRCSQVPAHHPLRTLRQFLYKCLHQIFTANLDNNLDTLSGFLRIAAGRTPNVLLKSVEYS